MITFSSSSISYAYQLLFILYHGEPAIFASCSLLNLFVYCQRLSCFGFVILAVIIRLACELRCYCLFNFWFFSAILSASTCIILDRLVVIFYCATLASTSLLFFFRTRAVFNTYPWVVAFFASLWLAVLCGCVANIVEIFEPIPNSASNTPICINPGINPFVAVATIIPLINDTLAFLAISWRLYRNSYDPYTFQGGVRFLIFGDYLPAFSKALLQDGQAYYLLAFSYLFIVLKVADISFQDNRYHKYHNSDHVISSFKFEP